MEFQVYQSKDGPRWRKVAGNNEIVASSGEAFSSMEAAREAAEAEATENDVVQVYVDDPRGGSSL